MRCFPLVKGFLSMLDGYLQGVQHFAVPRGAAARPRAGSGHPRWLPSPAIFPRQTLLAGGGKWAQCYPYSFGGCRKSPSVGAYATFATPSYLEGGGNFTSALTKVWRIRGTAWKHQLAAALDAGCPVTTHPKYRHGAGREKRCRTPKRPVG